MRWMVPRRSQGRSISAIPDAAICRERPTKRTVPVVSNGGPAGSPRRVEMQVAFWPAAPLHTERMWMLVWVPSLRIAPVGEKVEVSYCTS